MGEYISVGESIFITIFSMVTVFIVLVVIALLIGGLRSLGDKEEEEVRDKTLETKIPVKEENTKDIEELELVAVIAAAIASSMGVEPPQINIKSIKRVPKTIPSWRDISRREQINGRL